MRCLKTFLILWAAFLVALSFSDVCTAQSVNGSVTVVSHVDIIPSAFKPGSEEAAAKLFRAQALATQHDAGLVSYAILQQDGGSNHFTLVETWRDARSYELHQGATHTVKFRRELQPLLGSPFDAREHHTFYCKKSLMRDSA